VPARGVDPGRARPFGERAVAFAPEERVVAVRQDVVARRRHVEVRVPVQVEVGRDAAAAAEHEVGARAAADVLEAAVHVAEERRARPAALLVPAGEVVVRI
jgi:hypothetical protein